LDPAPGDSKIATLTKWELNGTKNMCVRRTHKATRREPPIDRRARAWANGDKRGAGFFIFKPTDELQAVWDEYGNKSVMRWDRTMMLPELI
jgi:hypothetical protein